MNNFLKFVLKHKLICKIVLFLYALYCSVLIGISWDENYYKILGKINLNYLLSFGILDEDYYAKFRYSTLYWSFSYFITQLLPSKFSVEFYHIINTIFGLFVCVGLYKITKNFFNKPVAYIAFLFLFFTPFFFGHFAINNKDTILAFSHVWIIYYLTKYCIKDFNLKKRLVIIFKLSLLSALATGIQLLFIGSLIPVFFIFIISLVFLKRFNIKIFCIDFTLYLLLFYLILILFWVDTHVNILLLPYKFFLQTLTLSNIGWPFNLINGKYVFSNNVGFNYLLVNYFYKLPEFIIFLYLILAPIILIKFSEIKKYFKYFTFKFISILLIILYPNIILIIIPFPIYDGLRLFLWVTPYLLIIPAILTYYIFINKGLFFNTLKFLLCFLSVFHLVNFISLTPYHYTYLNAFSGPKNERYKKFENDYWSVTLKELILKSNLNNNEIRFTSCGVNPEITKIYMKQKYKKSEHTRLNESNYIIMTNRTLFSKKNNKISNCFDEYSSDNVHQVTRNGIILSAIKKINNE